MKEEQINGEVCLITFASMRIGAKFMLQNSLEFRDGRLYSHISSLIYSAFTMEAYLNHLGTISTDIWDKKTNNFPVLKKFELLAKNAKIEFDYCIRPYITLKELFQFRNQIAHGKTINRTINCLAEECEDFDKKDIEIGWRNFATFENSKRCIEDVEELITKLHLSSGYSENPFSKISHSFYGISQKNY